MTQLQSMMSSPQFLEQMSSVMSNPAILDQIIASNPHLAAMEPQVRQVFQSDQFRQMMSAPLLSRTYTYADITTSCYFQVEPRYTSDDDADGLRVPRARRRWWRWRRSIWQPIRRTRRTRRPRPQFLSCTWYALDRDTHNAIIHNSWTTTALSESNEIINGKRGANATIRQHEGFSPGP